MQERKTSCNAPTRLTEKQRSYIRGVQAMFDKAEAILDQAQASACRLEASAQSARATVTDIKAIKTRLDAKITDYQGMGKHHRLVLHAGKYGFSAK